jgi:uncharacterized membrane protein (DUF106 family)
MTGRTTTRKGTSMNDRKRVEKVTELTRDITALYEAARAQGDREKATRLWNEREQMITDAGLGMKPASFSCRAGKRQAAERRAMSTRGTR